MGVVAIPGGRAVFSDSPAGLGVTIPAKRNPFMLLMVGLWMVGWAFGARVVVHELAGHRSLDFGTVFLTLWLAGWTVGGAVAARAWLWTAFGKERIVLRPATLSIRRDVLGIGRERRYDLPLITNLRIVPAGRRSGDPSTPPSQRDDMGAVALAFDYGGAPVHFAGGLPEAEAAFIVERLKTRHAFR